MNRRTICAVLLFVITGHALHAAIRRDPTGVNVNAQGPTTVFLTFGGLQNQRPAEAFWCGALIPATPDLGMRCRPDTIYGRLPLRYDRSRASGASGFTDIMSIPTSVVRRAWQDAARGEHSDFFYVRRFVSATGGPDEYVFVTCRLASRGARTPLALLDVRLKFADDQTLLSVPVGTTPPPFHAELRYNGTGRITGRWEIVLPGEEPPGSEDLLTEATLPVERRPLQRRYTELDRFSVFLPPTGEARLEGPDPSRLPAAIEGLYMILLRIEAAREKESESNLALAGAGEGVVAGGAAAGFPLPVLRYYVGSLGAGGDRRGGAARLLLPRPGEIVTGAPIFSWTEPKGVSFQRLEVREDGGKTLLTAVLPVSVTTYRAPSWFDSSWSAPVAYWRVVGLDREGEPVAASEWRRIVKPPE